MSGPSPAPQPSPGKVTESQWAIAIHLSALLAIFGCSSVPGLNLIGPLAIWLFKRPESAYLDSVGKRVLNFQISWAIYLFVALAVIGILWFVLVGILLLPVLGIGMVAWLIFTIIGAIKESNGEPYDFPLTIRFLK